MANLIGPRVLADPWVVHKGESFKPEVTIYDGVRTASAKWGAVVDVSAATKKAILRINKPDGSSDLTRDTSVSGEGEKSDAANGEVRFFVADTVTTGWAVGTHEFECEYQDSGPSPEDKRLILVGKIEVREKPSAAS